MVKITGRIKKYGNSYYFGIPKAFIDQEIISERELITCDITPKIEKKEEKKNDEPAAKCTDLSLDFDFEKNSLLKNLTKKFSLRGLVIGN